MLKSWSMAFCFILTSCALEQKNVVYSFVHFGPNCVSYTGLLTFRQEVHNLLTGVRATYSLATRPPADSVDLLSDASWTEQNKKFNERLKFLLRSRDLLFWCMPRLKTRWAPPLQACQFNCHLCAKLVTSTGVLQFERQKGRTMKKIE
jgi:hypothetical protein